MKSFFGASNNSDFLWSVLAQLLENIKFADQKAMFFVVINSGLLGFVYTAFNLNNEFSVVATGIATCLALAASVVLSIFVVLPRGGKNRRRGKGVVDLDRIAQFDSAEDFSKVYDNATEDELLSEAKIFAFDRSVINRQKYFYLKLAIWASAAGWVFALTFAVVFKFYEPLVSKT